MIRLALRISAALALGAMLAAPQPAAAQSPEAPSKSGPAHRKPQDKTGNPAAAKDSPQTSPTQTPASASMSANGAELDLAYGAYQRGFFLTAFALATNRVNQKSDPKAMTLIG